MKSLLRDWKFLTNIDDNRYLKEFIKLNVMTVNHIRLVKQAERFKTDINNMLLMQLVFKVILIYYVSWQLNWWKPFIFQTRKWFRKKALSWQHYKMYKYIKIRRNILILYLFNWKLMKQLYLKNYICTSRRFCENIW